MSVWKLRGKPYQEADIDQISGQGIDQSASTYLLITIILNSWATIVTNSKI